MSETPRACPVDEMTTAQKDAIVSAVLYALRQGCFFPVPEPRLTAGVHAWHKWGAMRNLHTKVAEACRDAS